MTTIAGLTKDAYETAVEAAVDTVRAGHPDLDLRSGTAVRALVVEPGALLDSMQRDVVARLRTAMSLKAMARETTVPREDAEAVLSNFGITLGGGTKATGVVRVNLTGTAPVTVREGAVFSTEDSLKFIVTKTTTAAVDPADGESEIRPSVDGRYYFTVPVEAEEVGSAGNIQQGHALTCSVILGNYYSSEAFSDFSGGEDGESVASAVARIPAALAYRGMTNDLSVRARLAASFADPATLRAVSCVGYRSRAQLRDKHNLFGMSVGGRVDVYARLFDAPGVASFVLKGELVETLTDPYPEEGTVNKVGKYRIPLPDLPGFYAVRYVGPASDMAARRGSLQYELVREAVPGASADHDFDFSKDCCEAAWSAYQGGTLYAYCSDDDEKHIVTAATVDRPASMDFKVDLYWTDGIAALQKLVDSPEVRNVAADYVVRSPAICLVGVTAQVRLKPGVSVPASDLEDAVATYINGRSFVSRLTRSEIANILLQHGVESVDLGAAGMQLNGRICGADGQWYYLGGDALDVTAVGPERAMLTDGTTVFATEPGAVQVTTGT